MASIIQLRRDTATNWTSVNPILANGEQWLETDTGLIKIGDGVKTWTELDYNKESIEFDWQYKTPEWVVSWSSTQEWIDLHFQSINPTMQIDWDDNFGLYEVGDNRINPIIKARVTMWQNPIWTLINIRYYRGTISGAMFAENLTPSGGIWENETDTFTVTTEQRYTVTCLDSEWRTATASWIYSFSLPTFGTSSSLTVMTKQTLKASNSSYFQCNMVAEDDTDKQKFDHPESFDDITWIQFYNTVSNSWEWLGWNRANSMNDWNITDTTQEIQGVITDYKRYTHSWAKVWARQLRFYK